MKLVLMSDSHNLHSQLQMPEGDVLLVAGDICRTGKVVHEMQSFSKWLGTLDYKHMLVIAGNHDFMLQNHRDLAVEILCQDPRVTYLEDSGIEIDGIYFWGSPWQPTFFDWAFNLDRGPEIAAKWNLIPDNTDVLITHGPPMGILDWVGRKNVGCADLMEAVNRVEPLLHVFGHIHTPGGKQVVQGNTIFVNAAVVNEEYQIVRNPIVIEI